MFNVILISHGPLAKAMLESAELLAGKQDDVKTFGLYEDDSVDVFREMIRDAIEESLAQNDQLLVLTDIMAGSPFNVTVAAMQDFKFTHLTGMNLAMVVEVLLDREDMTIDEVITEFEESVPNTIVNVNKFLEM